jgi:hypothetical protein
MKRIFGGKKEPPPPPPSLTDATETVNKRASVLDEKIRALDKQLVVCYAARRPSCGFSRCFSQDACGLPLAFNVGRLHTHDARAIPRYL